MGVEPLGKATLDLPTQQGKCYETLGLNRSDQLLIAGKNYNNDPRDFTAYLNNWTPVKALNG